MKHLVCGEVIETYCGKFTAFGTGMDWVLKLSDGSLMRGRIPKNSLLAEVGDRVAFYAQLHPDPIPILGQRFQCKYLWRRPTPTVPVQETRDPLELSGGAL